MQAFQTKNPIHIHALGFSRVLRMHIEINRKKPCSLHLQPIGGL